MMRRPPALALTAALGVAGIALAPTATAAPTDDSVAYLAAQLEAGDGRLVQTFGEESFDDLGLTIDAILGMTAAGSGGESAATATDYVIDNFSSYTGSGGEAYAAATAKLLTLVTARGLDPRKVGGTDLVEQLQSLEQDNGQFTDQSEYGDYSNTLGQSFALIGLKRAGVNPSTAAVDRLLSEQCADGGFALNFGDGCTSDPDATSMAVQALDAVGGRSADINEAADYLASRQDEDGGVGGGTSTEAANANSTGLAAVAFRIADRGSARDAALGYLDSVTFGCETPEITGGIAYNASDFDTAVAEGDAAQSDGSITRATAQALLGLTEHSYATATADGQSVATPVVDCSPDAGEGSEGGTDDGSPDDEGAGSAQTDGAAPEVPRVVQTDDAISGAPWGWTALGAGGLAAAVVLVLRRRSVQR